MEVKDSPGEGDKIMSWLECVCLSAPDHMRVAVFGTAGRDGMGLVREGMNGAHRAAPDRPLVIDLRGVDHLCAASVWELDRAVSTMERLGTRVVVVGLDPTALVLRERSPFASVLEEAVLEPAGDSEVWHETEPMAVRSDALNVLPSGADAAA
ncbi:hypothetical protein ACIB24_09975 [Spongisporangium articulatum]|uniref:STAS domain-containing protein n=1 Tax=Spongisporangium articulatum TaxID=3362603 RepID=A0ABW8ALZ2_9ACTN